MSRHFEVVKTRRLVSKLNTSEHRIPNNHEEYCRSLKLCPSEVVGMDKRKVKRSHSIAWHKSDCPDSHKGGACKVWKRAER